MKELLIQILESFGYPVKLQGSLGQDEKYPESFFTFWNNSANDGSHYDNDAINYIWDFTVYFYSTSPQLVNTVLLEAKKLLKQSGFIASGKGYDVPSDEPTHTGRAIDVLKIENQEVNEND